jgi:hypothetical protein
MGRSHRQEVKVALVVAVLVPLSSVLVEIPLPRIVPSGNNRPTKDI